jgi:hypothetical protein
MISTDACNVLMGSTGRHKLSRQHVCITFDEQKRVILRDFSTWGSSVIYNALARKKEQGNFTWILSLNE